jgi:hypothetical protein
MISHKTTIIHRVSPPVRGNPPETSNPNQTSMAWRNSYWFMVPRYLRTINMFKAYIIQAYFSGKISRKYGPKYGTITYLHQLDPEIPVEDMESGCVTSSASSCPWRSWRAFENACACRGTKVNPEGWKNHGDRPSQYKIYWNIWKYQIYQNLWIMGSNAIFLAGIWRV